MSSFNPTVGHAHADSTPMDIFGFWIYIMTDCILFACLFATYAVLYKNTYGGPAINTLVSLGDVFQETIFLLCSSFTYGLSIVFSYEKKRLHVIIALLLTILLGGLFITLELKEFIHLFQEGHTWQTSGALSGFFTLVGTHGLHVSLGLMWMLLLIFQLLTHGLTPIMQRRLTYLGLFWAFLDIVWIFVFTVVYLAGGVL